MLFLSLMLILLGGGILGFLFKKINLPSLIGYLLAGIVFGYFHLLDNSITGISSQLREIALIIILIKAGLSLDIQELKKVGRPAILMSFIPACFEMCAIGLAGPAFLGISYVESFILGAVLGAVSPAVVVPRMVKMIEESRGTDKGIPQIIIAGSSMDDIVMIVFYTSFMTIESGDGLSFMTFLNVPISIVTGIAIGILVGFLFSLVFEKVHMRDSLKLTLVLGACFGLVFVEGFVSKWFGFSSLLAVITIGIVILARRKGQAERLAAKCDRLWSVAEVFLFVLVGASIKIDYALTILIPALIVILIGLVIRSIGVYGCLLKTKLTLKEKSFVVISYLPKATVQAAIGGGLLDLGNSMGNPAIIVAGTVVLSVSVVSILFTAPVGAFLMDVTYKKLTNQTQMD
jgi:solute carrier family 9B (sodium/hydrogen exchanger), member 1/2